MNYDNFNFQTLALQNHLQCVASASLIQAYKLKCC